MVNGSRLPIVEEFTVAPLTLFFKTKLPPVNLLDLVQLNSIVCCSFAKFAVFVIFVGP